MYRHVSFISFHQILSFHSFLLFRPFGFRKIFIGKIDRVGDFGEVKDSENLTQNLTPDMHVSRKNKI